MTKEEAVYIFNNWFNWDGHWIWGVTPEGKARAMAHWQKYGIESLPDYPM